MLITVWRRRLIKLRNLHGKQTIRLKNTHTWVFVFRASVIWLTGFNPQSAFRPKGPWAQQPLKLHHDWKRTLLPCSHWCISQTGGQVCPEPVSVVGAVSSFRAHGETWPFPPVVSTLHTCPLRSPDTGAAICSKSSVSRRRFVSAIQGLEKTSGSMSSWKGWATED